jgi:hypothetical protein
MRRKPFQEPPVKATVDSILNHIHQRLQTLGNKTHGPAHSDEERLRAAHGIRELVKLQTWITGRQS